ncbi:hypothetical protein [Enterovibrio calviensis]|uniref:hypothetical protein n=1 Tax=Enterovibrio calviensis TaxID=91359 RepID=UPI003736BCE2
MPADQSFVESLNAVWATPYGVAAKFIFMGGVLLLFVLMVTRQKMTILDALLAIVGFKPVQHRDKLFNVLHLSVIGIPLALFALAM